MTKTPLLIGLVGRARSGKDTAAGHLVRNDFIQATFADPLKSMLTEAFGPHFRAGDREQPLEWLGKSPRYLMQTLGTEWGRNLIHPDLWVLLAKRKWLSFRYRTSRSGMVFSDVRFENEARWIVEAGGCLIEILRPDAPKVADHVSEQADLSKFCAYRVVNDGTLDDLYRKLDDVMSQQNGK